MNIAIYSSPYIQSLVLKEKITFFNPRKRGSVSCYTARLYFGDFSEIPNTLL